MSGYEPRPRAEGKQDLGRTRTLVTGGAGYLGSILVRLLLEHGHDVTVLDAFLYGDRSIRDVADRVRVVHADIRDELAQAEALCGADGVVHLAEIVGEPACALAPKEAREVNLTATCQLAGKARAIGIRRFIYASSCSVYGFSPSPEPLRETAPLRPIGLYANLKQRVEEHLTELADAAFGPTLLRFATLHGRSHRPRFDLVVNKMTADALQNGRIFVHGASNRRPNISVTDAARAIIAILEAPQVAVSGQVFNISNDAQNHSIGELAEIVRTSLGGRSVPVVETGGDDTRSYAVSASKVARMLGFNARLSLPCEIGSLAMALISGTDGGEARYSNVESLKLRGDLAARPPA